MTSFIIVAKDKEKRESYAKTFAQKLGVDPLDVTTIEKDAETKSVTQSIGIDMVKLIQKKIFLKPLKSAHKIVIIEDAQLLTPEAQNALLKVLEEPPANTSLILGTVTKEALLPTIQSRCQIIELVETKEPLSEKNLAGINQFLDELADLSTGERLKQAEQLAKEKDKLIPWLENVILVLRERLLTMYETRGVQQGAANQQSRKTFLSAIVAFQNLHTLLHTTNVNARFAIEVTLLGLTPKER